MEYKIVQLVCHTKWERTQMKGRVRNNIHFTFIQNLLTVLCSKRSTGCEAGQDLPQIFPQ